MNIRSHVQAFIHSLRIHRVRGPRSLPQGVILLCRVENGEEWIPHFLAHYRALGIAHMIFLDTGSSDRTIDLLTGNDVTVYRTSLPFKTHRLWMRRWLMRRCPRGTWTMNVDIDELFVSTMSLSSLIVYLNRHHYTAMRAHMLDMFASGPIGFADAPSDTPLTEQYPWYDLSAVHPLDLPAFFGADIPAFAGGIRKSHFGVDCWLTKHPLLKTGHDIRAFENDEHSVAHATVTDITGVLLHFKFTPSFRRYVDESVHRGQHWNESAEYKVYQSILTLHPDLSLKRETAKKWHGIDALIDGGFLSLPSRERQYAIGSSTRMSGTQSAPATV